MKLSGAMMLFLAVFFFWNCVVVIELMVRGTLTSGERIWLFSHMLLCGIGAALFGICAVYEIIRLVRVYG